MIKNVLIVNVVLSFLAGIMNLLLESETQDDSDTESEEEEQTENLSDIILPN